jgi:hypothetical protein
MDAFIQAGHLVFLSILYGAILVVDLRLIGAGFRQQPIIQIARDAQPWLIAGLIGMVITGVPQVMSKAIKEYNAPFFWTKMQILLVAFIFTITVRHWVTRTNQDRLNPIVPKIVGVISSVLWISIPIPARLIGLV